MRIPALLDSAKRLRARGGASLIDQIVALTLLVVALGVLAAAPRDDSPVLAVVTCVVQAGAVALRRRMPTLSAAAASAGLIGFVSVTHDGSLAAPPIALILTSYTFGRLGAQRHSLARLVVVTGLGLAATWTVSAQLNDTAANAASSWLVTVIAPLAVGMLLARRSRLSQRLAATADQLRAEQDLNTAHATAEERHRVARDLHDVVAHCVSVMVVQAGAARLVAAHNRADADRALAVIGDCGRDAMVDLRRIVGVLRRTEDPDFGRGAGLADLEPLIHRIQAAGVATTLDICCSTGVPPAIDVVAFRVVQEALTNVVKHAGIGATAVVDVRVGPEAVTVEVTNTSEAQRPSFTPSGHGLAGMRERVTAYGGDLRVGPGPEGGYGVRARIPFRPVGAAAVDTSDVPQMSTVRRSPRMSPRATSGMIVAFWLVVLEIEVATSSARQGPWLLNAAAVAAMASAAGWRRRYPLLCLVVVGTLAAALSGGLTSLDRSTVTGLYSLAVPLFAVAAWEPRTRATLGLALWVAVSGGLAVVHKAAANGLVGASVIAVVVWAVGRVWRAQLLLNADLTATAARLAAERDHRAQLAVATERIRIARDLHGPVAHGVITMVVQADAARKLLVYRPGEVEVAIREIEQTGRDALAQLRRILGVLRSSAGASSSTGTGAAGTPPRSRLESSSSWTPEQVLT